MRTVDPVSGEPVPRVTSGDPCDRAPLDDARPIAYVRYGTEEWETTVVREGDEDEWEWDALDEDEDDGEGCDGDDLHADDRCDECGVLLATHDGLHGLCAECREDEDDETTDDEEYD